MVQLALFALVGLGVRNQQPTSTDVDVWYYQSIEVTDHAPFDHTPSGTYDARDAFGGVFGTVPGEQGHVVFEDDTGGPSHEDFIDWNTKTPVVINRLVFSWQDDGPGHNWRNLAQFRILGRQEVAGKWDVLWQQATPFDVGHYTLEKKMAPGQYQYFRVELLRGGTTEITADAPRICSIEAYGKAVNP